MARWRRNNILPRIMSDVGAFTFVTCMIPLSYVWEVVVVTPGKNFRNL
jgi:hypothetical protein